MERKWVYIIHKLFVCILLLLFPLTLMIFLLLTPSTFHFMLFFLLFPPILAIFFPLRSLCEPILFGHKLGLDSSAFDLLMKVL